MEISNNLTEKSRVLEAHRHYSEDDGENSTNSNENAFDDMKQLIDADQHKSSLPWTSFNFINSILGSGIIAIPYAFRASGFGLGVILMMFVAYITDYSLILMVRCGHLSGRFSYQGIMETAFGKTGYILLGIIQFLYPFIAMISYNVVVGDTVTKVVMRITGLQKHDFFARREFIVLVATLFITVPLCLYRNISRLAKISFLSLVCILFMLFAIFMRIGTMTDVVPSQPDAWKFANSDVIEAIGIMAFAFMCHHNTFILYSSIVDASQTRWDVVTHISLFTSFVVALLFGTAGYATFTSLAQGDLLENYCWDDDLMNFSRLLFSVQILLTYPIECFVTREVIEQSLFQKDQNAPVTERTHCLITLLIITSTYLISISTDCLGVVLVLNGELAAVPLAYILPGLSYLKLEEGHILSWKKLPALGVVLFGSVVAVLGAVFLVLDFNTSTSCSHGVVMDYCRHVNESIAGGGE